MAYQKPGLTESFDSAADLTGKEYFLAVVDSSAQADLAGAGENAVGTIQEGKVAGKHSTLMLSGITKVVAGAAVAAGAKVMSNAAGKGITATSTNHVVGVALTAAGAEDEVFAMHIGREGILA